MPLDSDRSTSTAIPASRRAGRRALAASSPHALASCLAAALIAGAGLLAPAPARADGANRIIARVNDRIATLYDYEVRLEDAQRRTRDLPEDQGERQRYLDQLAREVMRDVFEELLILSRADQLDITVTAEEVTTEVNKMRERSGLQDDQQFKEALAQSGMTPELLRTQFEQQMRFQRVIGREVYSEVKLKEEDLRRYYRDHVEDFRQPETVKVREVVVLDESGTSPQAAATAASLVAELRGGKPLEEAIAPLPKDSVTVIDLGWVESGDLDAAVRLVVWALPVGDWTEPTRARGGLHIAQVVERKESTVPSFKDVEAEIRQREERARLDVRMKDYLAELEKKSFLYLDPPPEAAGFRTSAGEAPGGVEFPMVAPGTMAAYKGKGAKGAAAAASDEAASDESAAEGAEEGEIERGLEKLEEEPPPDDAPEPDAPPPPRSAP